MSGRLARSARWVAAAGGVLVLLGLAVWGLVQRGTFDAWLTGYLATRLDQGLRFASARAVWWPRPGVVLADVAFDTPAGTPPIGAAGAAAVTCRVRLAALLAGRVEIGAVRVDGLQLGAVRDADGRLYAGGLEAFADDDEPTDLFPSFPVIRVHGGTLGYRDARGGAGELRLGDVRAQAGPRGAGAWAALEATADGGGSVRARGSVAALDAPTTAPFSADLQADGLAAATVLTWLPPLAGLRAGGRLRATASLAGTGGGTIDGDAVVELADGSAAWSAWQADSPLRIAAHATWDGEHLALSRGGLDVARLAYPPLAAQALHASFAYDDRTLRVDAAELRTLGGTVRPSGRVSFAPPARVDAALQAADIDGAELVAAVRAFGVSGPLPRIGGALRGDARASGEPGGSWEGGVALATDGSLDWDAVQVAGPLQASADLALAAGALRVSNGRASARRVSHAGIAVDAVSAAFSYGHGAVAVAPLRGGAFGGTWTYTGTVPTHAAAAWRGQLDGAGVSAAALGAALAPGAAAVDAAVDLRAQLDGTGSGALRGPLSLSLSSPQAGWNELRVLAPATVSATLQVERGRVRLRDGQARARALRVADVTAQDVAAAFAYADQRIDVPRLEGKAFRGSWLARGSAGLGAAPRVTASVRAQRVDLDDLFDEVERRVSESPRAADGIGDMTVDLTREPDGDVVGSATVQLTAGSFAFDDLLVHGPARGAGDFAVRGGTLTLNGATAQAARASYGPLRASDARAAFAVAGSRLSFSELRFTSCGGAWSNQGWFTLRDGGRFAGQLVVEGAVPSQVVAMLGYDPVGLTFTSLDVDSEYSGRAVPDFTARLHATGSMSMRDGTLRAANVLRPIWEGLVGGGRVTDVLSRPTTHVQDISGTFALRDERVNSTDLSLVSDDYRATALGSIGLDGTLDLRARIQVTSQGAQKMLVFGSLPLPTSALPDLPPIPASVTGSVENPIIRPNMAALPATTVRWLVDALLQTPRTLGESVLHRLGQVWNGAKRAVGR